jgi:hypothetical protein
MKQCFLCCSCRNVISRTVSSNVVFVVRTTESVSEDGSLMMRRNDRQSQEDFICAAVTVRPL